MSETENHTLQQLVMLAAKQNANNCAVSWADELSSYNYSKLIDLSSRISFLLSKHSLFQELVLCISKPHLLTPAMILGILHARCSFCFADLKNVSTYCKNLQRYVKVKFLLCEWNTLKNLKTFDLACVEIDELSSEYGKLVLLKIATETKNQSDTEEICKQLCAGCAYVIQTSGTTGEPKVVQVPQRCILPNIIHLRSLFKVCPEDKILHLSPLTFDPSIIEVFLALTSGASLIIVSHEMKMMPKLLAKTIQEYEITIMQATPTLIRSFGNDLLNNVILCKASTLRILALGGESCPSTGTLKKWQSAGNSTTFYNLYGITEVSCWATYHKITDDELIGPDHSVPLGKCLSETVVQVLDSSGLEVSEGEGELYVGSMTRHCIINDSKDNISINVMRATGDWGKRTSEGNLYYMGRQDSVVKHNGKKVNIAIFEHAVLKLNFVDSCSLLYHQEDKMLYIFVVCVQKKPMDNELSTKIIEYLRNLSTDIPLQVLCISFLPQTLHGKIDTQSLLNYIKHMKMKRMTKEMYNAESLNEKISALWKKYTGSESLNAHSQFVQDGGDSVAAVQLQSEMEQEIGNECPILIDKLLNSTFEDVSNYLLQLVASSLGGESSVSRSVKRTSDFSGNERSKQAKLLESIVESLPNMQENFYNTGAPILPRHFTMPSDDMICFRNFSRRGEVMNCSCLECVSNICSIKSIHKMQKAPAVCKKEMWKYNLAKCVDASPLVVKYKSNQTVLFIGSHSGHFTAINVQTGEALWEKALSDRIESSACISKCGHYIAVGCYDCCIYCMETSSGKLQWKVQTCGEVKSSPVSDVYENVFYCGSHDKHLYAVIAHAGTILWKQKIANGSVFSSPAVSRNPHCVIAASLDGVIASLNPSDGSFIWKFDCGKPVFSSPLAVEFGICVGCVDNFIYFWSHQGEQVWAVSADGPVFSSPTHLYLKGKPVRDLVVVGSQSAFILCIELLRGSIVWNFRANSAVYATPYVFALQETSDKVKGRMIHLVAAASKTGILYILDATNGKELYSHSLPGEVFSSPVVCDNYLLIGCRDNYVYCYDLLTLLQDNT